jgi:hypothetical protein
MSERNSPVRAESVVIDAPDTGRKRRKVTRSRLGCLTCRKRRKLCDMTKPFCNACSRLKMVRGSDNGISL